jgi:flagellar motor switch protein FliG
MPDLEDLERRIKHIEDTLGIVDKYTYDFADLAENLDHRTLEQIWQGMDTRGIALALIGLNREQLLRIRPTLSKARWNEITRELVESKPEEFTESTIQHFREMILDRIHELEKMGGIVVARGEDRPYISLPSILNKPEELHVDVQTWLQSVFEKV